MNVVYTTPNREWEVKGQSDPEWQSIFGYDKLYYNAYRISDNLIVYCGGSIEDTLRWFRKMNIISEDEMKYQIEKIGK